jgi:hypothetical protein
MKDVGRKSTFHRYHFLLHILPVAIFASFLFIVTIIIGIWDLIEGDVLIEGTEGILGGIILVIGIILPFVLLKFVFKWPKAQISEFAGYNIGILISFMILGVFLFIPEITIFLFWKPLNSSLILLGGIVIMAISSYLLLRPKNHYSIVGMFTGSALTLLGIYNFIGSILNLI